MKPLPEVEIYDRSLIFWPYRKTLAAVLREAIALTPADGRLLDMMCGTGHLLGKIAEVRRDLSLHGVDIDERYVSHARSAYGAAIFSTGNVLDWQPMSPYDVVVCSGSLHHVSYELQYKAVANIARMVKSGGTVIISDCYIDPYLGAMERQLAAAKLGYAYLREVIRRGAPDDVLGWTIDILSNDVLMHEYKPSLRQRLPLIRKHFARVSTTKTWPSVNEGYGEFVPISPFP